MRYIFDKLTRLSLRFRAITIVLVLALMSLGVISWTNLNQELLPPIELPQTIVLAQTSGMTSNQVLEIVTKPIEDQLRDVSGIINLESETTGTFGALLVAYNNFGEDQEAIQADLQQAINQVWLPLRTIAVTDTDAAAALLGELDGATIMYLAETDSNFLFQLSPETWSALSDDAVLAALAYLAQTEEEATTSVNVLQRLVEKEVVPQLDTIPEVASIEVAGGETLPSDENGVVQQPTGVQTAPEPLLVRLSPEIWTLLAPRIDGLNPETLDDASLSVLAATDIDIPDETDPPALPLDWQYTNPEVDEADRQPTFFYDASDLAELGTLTRSIAASLNEFAETGRITGAIVQTNDLTVEIMQRMLEFDDASMGTYFEADQILAMPRDVFDFFITRDDVIDQLDGFTRDAIAARAMAESIAGDDAAPVERTPVELPSAWQIQPPQLITFSFSDIPLATFSVSATTELSAQTIAQESVEAQEDPAGTVDEAGEEEQAGNGDSEDDEAGASPLLNPEWNLLAQGFADQGFEISLRTADDLLALPLPFNVIVGQLLETPEVAAFLPSLFGNLPLDAAEYLIEQDPGILNDLPPELLVFLSDDVVALLDADVQATIPIVMPGAWTPLLEEATGPQVVFTTTTVVALAEDGQPSTVLNRIDSANLSAGLDTYTVRLMDSLTPAIIEAFLTEEPAFFENLEASVLLKFSAETLALLDENQIADLESLSDEESARLIAIRNGETDSAFAELEALYASDVPQGDPRAPDLNDEWAFLEPQYQIELDSADDFFRFPEGYTYANAAELINSVFVSQEGANFAPQLLGNMPVAAVEYILNCDTDLFEACDPDVLNGLSSQALVLLPAEVLAILPQDLQARAEEVASEYTPESQITRTNSNPSLFVTVFKEPDANTVTTYAEVESLLQDIDEQDENIITGVVFEQSSFVEQSVEGVAREGLLGAIFAVIIILVFLSGGSWGMRGRRMVGAIMVALFVAGIFLATVLNLGDTHSTLGEAFAAVDVVFRVLLIFGVLAGLFVMFWPGNVPDPSWRATLVIAVSIPLSIMIALTGMYWIAPAMNSLISPIATDGSIFEFILRLFPEELTLNIMTLSGLTVAVGRVVDDSIVVLENIFRQLQAGGDKKEAILQGTRDVSAAIFVATMIAVVVFLPLGLTGGLIGAFFLPFGLAVTYALIGSFIVALTVVPVLAYLFIDTEDMPEDGDIWVADYYLPVLKWSLKNWRNKFIVIGVAVFSMLFAFYLFGQRPFAFLPNFGEPQVSITVNMPNGTSIIDTNERVEAMETWINENIEPEKIQAIQTFVGSTGANFDTLLGGSSVSENQASITVGLDVSAGELEQLAEQIEVEAKYIFNLCPTDDPDIDQRALMTTVEIGGATEVICRDYPAEDNPIDNNVEVAAASIADGGFGGFALVVSGPVDAEVNDQIIAAINNVDGLGRAESNFVADRGAQGDTNATFIRVEQTEAFSYTAEIDTEDTIGVTQDAILAIEDIPTISDNLCASSAEDTSNCFRISQGFESEIQTEGFESLFVAMILAILIVIVILASTMQSFVYWLAIIFAIFVAPVGAAIALTVTDRVLGISALIGLLMLIGLVIANAVVLIDRVRSNRRERGMSLYDALVEAGGRRLRPILMTSLATIIALTPLAIGLSEGAIIASELGTAVIGGSISSTLLTLIVTPVVFSLLSPLHRILSFRKDAETRGNSAADRPVAAAETD